MITVSEVIKNSCLKKYPVACGLNGIDNEVIRSGIVDYEFSIEGYIEKNNSFGKGDFLISSLLFTHGDEEKLLDMVQKLVRLDVSGLAVKNIFFSSIPDKVRNFCDENQFPVVLFDNDIYFEDIVSDIDGLLKMSDWVNKAEHQIEIMLGDNLTRYEVEALARDMGLFKGSSARVYWIRPQQALSQNRMKKTVKEYANYFKEDRKSFLFKYRQFYLFVVIQDDTNQKNSQILLEEALRLAGHNLTECSIGAGGVHDSMSELDFSLREAAWSCQVATLLNKSIMNYHDMGIWSIAAAHCKSPYMAEYAQRYLSPLVSEKADSTKDLLETLITTVLCEGNSKISSKKLNIHDNTYRYRMNKIREKTDPNASDYIFYENSSIAVKIYLLRHMDWNI